MILENKYDELLLFFKIGLLKNFIDKEIILSENNKKVWIYQNKIIVLDIVINNNRIAFDIIPDYLNNSIEILMFSRNNLNSLDSLKEKAIRVEKNKILIFDGKLEQKKEAIEEIKNYFEKVKK